MSPLEAYQYPVKMASAALAAIESGSGGFPEWISPILQFGVGGGVLVWFMFRSEPRLRAIEASIDRMARSVLLLVVSLPQANPPTKQQAQGLIHELDDAAAKRREEV